MSQRGIHVEANIDRPTNISQPPTDRTKPSHVFSWAMPQDNILDQK